MDQDTAWLLARISVFAGLVPALVAMLNIKNANDTQKKLSLLVLVALLTELFAFILLYVIDNNLFVSHIFTLIEFFLLGTIYRKELSTIITPKYFNGMIIVFISSAIIYSLFFETYLQFNAKTRAVSSLLIIGFVLAYFYKILQEVKIQKLESEPLFWLSIGLLIYFSTSFFIFIFSNYIRPSVKLSFTFWGIHAILNISLYFFYAIALWIKPPKTV